MKSIINFFLILKIRKMSTLEDLEPFTLENYKNIPIDELININGKFYHISNIYDWIVIYNHSMDPLKNKLSYEDIERIKEFYNEYQTKKYYDNLFSNYEKNKIMIFNKIKEDSCIFHRIPDKLKNNREFILDILDINYKIFDYLIEEFKSDQEILLIKERKIILEKVSLNGNELQNLTEDLKNDFEVVKNAVKENGLVLEYASDILKNNYEIVKEAYNQNKLSLQFASSDIADKIDYGKSIDNKFEQIRENYRRMQNCKEDDKDTMLELLKKDHFLLKYVPEKLKYDRDIVLSIVRCNYNILENAPENIKNDREIIIKAVTSNGTAIKYSSEELKKDREIVLIAIRNSTIAYAFTYIHSYFKSDRKIIMEVLKKNGSYLHYASEELKNDKEIALAAIKECKYAYESLSENMKKDPDLIKLYLKKEN